MFVHSFTGRLTVGWDGELGGWGFYCVNAADDDGAVDDAWGCF